MSTLPVARALLTMLLLLLAAGPLPAQTTPRGGPSPRPRPAAAEVPPFTFIQALAYAGDDPALGDLARTWVVGDARSLKLVDDHGGIRTVAELTGPVTAVAGWPAGAHPQGAAFVAFASSAAGGKYDPFTIWALQADGTVRVLAGPAPREPGGGTFKDGPALEARFGRITGLACGLDGSLYVADEGNHLLRRLSPEGEVSTLAGQAHGPLRSDQPAGFYVRDGLGTQASFGLLRGLALDPASGMLYLADQHCLRRVSPAGEVTTILGDPSRPGPVPGREGPVALGAPCLHAPQGLQVQGGALVLVDGGSQTIRVFHPEARTLQTMVGTPVPFPSGPDAPATVPLERPVCLALSTEGICLVALPRRLARIDPGHAPTAISEPGD